MLYVFYNNELQKHKNDNILKFYGPTNHMYPTCLLHLIYITHKGSLWASII